MGSFRKMRRSRFDVASFRKFWNLARVGLASFRTSQEPQSGGVGFVRRISHSSRGADPSAQPLQTSCRCSFGVCRWARLGSFGAFLRSDSRHSGIVFKVLDPNTAVGRLMFEKVTLRNIRGITHPYHRRKVDGNLHLFASIPGAHQGRRSKPVRSEVGFVDHR
jgi:hypothetical protein